MVDVPEGIWVARLLIDGRWVDGDAGAVDVVDKYTGALIGRASRATREATQRPADF